MSLHQHEAAVQVRAALEKHETEKDEANRCLKRARLVGGAGGEEQGGESVIVGELQRLREENEALRAQLSEAQGSTEEEDDEEEDDEEEDDEDDVDWESVPCDPDYKYAGEQHKVSSP